MSFLQSAERGESTRLFRFISPGIAIAACDALVFACAFLLSGLGFALLGLDAAQGAGGLLTVRDGLASSLLLFAAFAARGHYRPGLSRSVEAFECCVLAGLVGAGFALAYGLAGALGDALPVTIGLLLTALALPPVRQTAKLALSKTGSWRRQTVVIGHGVPARRISQALRSDRYAGFDVCEQIGIDSVLGGPSAGLMAARRDGSEAAWAEDHVKQRYAQDRTILFIFTMDPRTAALAQSVLPVFVRHGFQVGFAPLSSEITLSGFRRHRIAGVPGGIFVSPATNTPPDAAIDKSPFFPVDRIAPRTIKRLFDITAALAGLILCAPVFAVLSFLIRRDGGPAFFSQTRIGRGGRPFRCLKFRTMVTDAEARLQALLASDPEAAAEWARDQKLRNDPRVTRVGRFLRQTSLDELPQLINVLKGDMSLIGPRPVVPSELDRYGPRKGYYLRVRPGITGLWQVSGRNKTTYEQRVMLDSFYVMNWTFLRDLDIIWKTVVEVCWTRSGV